MKVHEIICVKQDEQGVITHCSTGGRMQPIHAFIDLIENEEGVFFTNYNGSIAEVKVRVHPARKEKILQCTPDDKIFVDLDYLPMIE